MKPQVTFVLVVLLGLAIVSSGCDQPSSVKPLISKLKEPGTQTATISLGSEAGVNLGDVFDVYRENKQLGKLKITKVEPDQSTVGTARSSPPFSAGSMRALEGRFLHAFTSCDCFLQKI